MILPQELVRAACRAPLYRRPSGVRAGGPSLDSWPPIDLATLLDSGGDPFGGRRDPRRRPRVVLQVGDGLALYWALGAADMAGAAQALARCWRLLGIGPGDRVAIHDYGTSPMTLFASASYLSYLSAGAADLIGCTPICNDGLPELASRALHVLKYVRPSALFINAEAVPALVEQATRSRPHAEESDCTVVVSGDEQPLQRQRLDGWAQALGLPVRQMLRADAALFFAAPCPAGDAYHASDAHYLVEVLAEDGRQPLPHGRVGLLTVTNLFLRTCPVVRYVTDVRAGLSPGPCACGTPDSIIVVAG